ncbi:hypothetical protein HAX54_051761 [Datura stramonium]|uniref:Uncharacterized protein n=1 Tax=Datura stramonium TaxID=4076 RepID=A0ABS8SY30_DATST|nr:hypothetical protein [Datura stramonium]
MGSRAALNVFVLLVFVGWLFIWVMLPTKTYKYSWTPQLQNKLSSTYFREQGTNLLLFTFPIMLIAAVSCIYLHLYSKSTSDHSSSGVNGGNNKGRQYFGSWKRTVVVMEPLGIVNAVELTFAAMFTLLLIWSLANYIYVSYSNLHIHNPAVNVWMTKFRSVFLRIGYIGNICYAFLFFPVTRLSSILPMVGLTSESSIKYHIWLGHVSMALAVLHSVGFVIFYAMSNQMTEMIEWSSTYVSNVAGEIATLVAIAIRECLVMVSGGSGITPMISIFRELIYRSTQQPNTKVPKVILITSFKNTSDLTMLDLLLPFSATPSDISNLDFQIQAYITRENDPQQHDSLEAAQSKQQLIVFKQNPKDSPISAALGKSSWLWLGAIISSSFIMFLLLLGVVTRYSIYPVERDGKMYHYSAKIIWDMFLVCASVFIATSVIFVLQKRDNETEGKQIQNVEIPTNPTNSPAANLCGTETELESLPRQSIIQATKVHYGARPDLKRILFDCKASDVGVVVSGPKSMRHEVAKICASGLAQNLHFESISFNW